MDEDPRALHVAQERVAEAGAGRCALDEAGHVRDRGTPICRVAEVHDAQVRLEGREGVGRDLRPGRRERAQERRLARVRQPDEAHFGDQAKLEAQPALLAGLALLGVLGGAMGGGREVDVAQAAPTAPGDRDLLPGRHEIGKERARRVVEDARAGRDRDHEVVARLPVPLRAEAASAGLRPEVVREAEVAERRQARVHPDHDGAAATAVTTVRAAPRDVGLAAKRGGAVATVAGANPDRYAVEEHRGRLSHAPRPGPAAGVRSRPAG